ncbi:transglycosylase domain-containing protein [Citricoccus sp. NR2]|uniref:transglycosylase domain-containing protein n=1 Tax=Citricoccus sp. NR2 TaxID=3004095 RepID=UPI0022DD9E53|nr:transglycosylase domain-containing protein [Citricoccus sp. NR2]WBL20441.1 transglycosylase domain-containing protein [Citricoccus sp. NR2]
MASSRSPFFDTATTLGKVVAFFGIAALCGALAAGLMLPLGMVGGAAANTGSELLDNLPAELQEEPLSLPSTVEAADGTVLATFYAEDRTPVSLDEISQHMQDAIISVEDERFYEHGGVDGQGLARAIVNNLTTSTQQGASTLTQQYVNNVLVNYQNLNDLRTTVSGQKTVPDKLREMKLAVAIEKEMTKDEILEGYLNIVLFSGRVYGVEAASRYFFNKNAADLNIPESALLAGMVQSPNALNPLNNPEAAKSRRDTVLYTMLNNDKITQEEYEEAVASEIVTDETPVRSGCASAVAGSGYFCDYVQRQILADPAFGPDADARQRLLDRGGLTIKTTLDLDLQRVAAEQANQSVPREESDDIGAALITVEQNSGNIRAMAQNTAYSSAEGNGNTTLNFNVDKQWGGGNGFQAGSTLKPFVALAWLGSGKSMRDQVDASRDFYANGTAFPAYCRPGGATLVNTDGDGWEVNNAIADMKQRMRVDYGLFWSINTATVATAYATDLCAITDITTAAGIERADDGEPLSPQRPSFLLGAEEVSPMTMASAYSTLGSGGTYCEPRAIAEVTDGSGNSYEVPPVQCNSNALNSEDISELNHTLKAIADERIALGSINYDIAGKTGTNNFESSTWFIGYTSQLTTASWVGNYRNLQALTGRTIGGVTYDDVWGSLIAGPMWVDYMSQVADQYETNTLPDTGTGNPRSR